MTIDWQKSGTHIGIAVHSIHNAKNFYMKKLGLTWIKEEVVLNQGVKIAFLKAGPIVIELIEPLRKDHTVSKFLHTNGEGIHHLALGVSNLKETMNNLVREGVSFVSNQVDVGADQAQIAFITPRQSHGVLLELCQKPSLEE
ncbi:VOC family protein [Alkalicoccobacillus porphyridii]|uniref:VOC family protein n=1 Tax=Alkalicoccobacillus porphyridii TaxID=2597270 RepID=A0A553ZYZ9_9BACI|nr:VOC family protein [Alkalicoccobacillus porphyridii]TSB46679.1 VOC family protein [Alkalicoccobacillus porphyridii]